MHDSSEADLTVWLSQWRRRLEGTRKNPQEGWEKKGEDQIAIIQKVNAASTSVGESEMQQNDARK